MGKEGSTVLFPERGVAVVHILNVGLRSHLAAACALLCLIVCYKKDLGTVCPCIRGFDEVLLSQACGPFGSMHLLSKQWGLWPFLGRLSCMLCASARCREL